MTDTEFRQRLDGARERFNEAVARWERAHQELLREILRGGSTAVPTAVDDAPGADTRNTGTAAPGSSMGADVIPLCQICRVFGARCCKLHNGRG